MAILLLVAFIGIPIIEIALFIEVGSRIGVIPTIALTIATAVAGTLLLRTQGLATLSRARAQMDRGEMPREELFDGLCLLIAGGCLLTPGFFTDAVGLLLFIPAVRHLLRRTIASRMAQSEHTRIIIDGEEIRPGRRPQPGGGRGPIIEGEFTEVDDSDTTPRESADGRKISDSRWGKTPGSRPGE